MKVKEESEKICLKLNIQKTEITTFGPINSWQIDGETMEIVTEKCSNPVTFNNLEINELSNKLSGLVKGIFKQNGEVAF